MRRIVQECTRLRKKIKGRLSARSCAALRGAFALLERGRFCVGFAKPDIREADGIWRLFMPKSRAKYRESEGCARQNATKTKGKSHVKRMRTGKVWARFRCHDVARAA